MNREVMEFDVVVVGAGPSGLAASIRLAQLAEKAGTPLNICVIDKAEEIGGQILSGAAIEPRALNELIPDWQQKNPPEHTPITQDHFVYLTGKRTIRLPTPPQMHNHGNFIVSLGQFCKWLGTQAESLGVNVFPTFAAADVIEENGRIAGARRAVTAGPVPTAGRGGAGGDGRSLELDHPLVRDHRDPRWQDMYAPRVRFPGPVPGAAETEAGSLCSQECG